MAVQAIYSNQKVHTSSTQISPLDPLSRRRSNRSMPYHSRPVSGSIHLASRFSLLEAQTGPTESRCRVDAWFPAQHSPMPRSLST